MKINARRASGAGSPREPTACTSHSIPKWLEATESGTGFHAHPLPITRPFTYHAPVSQRAAHVPQANARLPNHHRRNRSHHPYARPQSEHLNTLAAHAGSPVSSHSSRSGPDHLARLTRVAGMRAQLLPRYKPKEETRPHA